MILIADSGSTKTDWGVISHDGSIDYFSTAGYNPFFMDVGTMGEGISSVIGVCLYPAEVRQLLFYGAGCQDSQVDKVKGALLKVFPGAMTVKVSVDLLAAAKALLATHPGFVAILGTGTNTCLYDGRSISYHIDSLGFLLGDEGSGAAIGKRVLVDFLRNQMDPAVREAFIRRYALDESSLMEHVYTATYPNRYCASFARFLNEPEVPSGYRELIVKDAFASFFEKLVCQYPSYKTLTFNCVGSIGYHFRDLLITAAENHGMKVGLIERSVIERLTHYYHSLL